MSNLYISYQNLYDYLNYNQDEFMQFFFKIIFYNSFLFIKIISAFTIFIIFTPYCIIIY